MNTKFDIYVFIFLSINRVTLILETYFMSFLSLKMQGIVLWFKMLSLNLKGLILDIYVFIFHREPGGLNRMVIGFTATCAISVHHH
jgi:hypothetical protein